MSKDKALGFRVLKEPVKTLLFTEASDKLVVDNINNLTEAQNRVNETKGVKPAMARAVARECLNDGIKRMSKKYGVKVVK